MFNMVIILTLVAEVVRTTGFVSRVANGADSSRPVVVRQAPHAELGTATTGFPPACHVVATLGLLNAMATLRAPDQALTVKELQQGDLVRVPRILIVLLAGALGVPRATVEHASPLAAMLAAKEHVPAQASRFQVCHDLPRATTSVGAPPKATLSLQGLPQEHLVVALVDRLRRPAHDILRL